MSMYIQISKEIATLVILRSHMGRRHRAYVEVIRRSDSPNNRLLGTSTEKLSFEKLPSSGHAENQKQIAKVARLGGSKNSQER